MHSLLKGDKTDEENGFSDSGSTSSSIDRWPPLGAYAQNEDDITDCKLMLVKNSSSNIDRIQKLEEEHEHLSNALIALTTHFAQVQFRLKQIVAAPLNERETLLEDLELFAFRGIPNTQFSLLSLTDDSNDQNNDYEKFEEKTKEQQVKQKELMKQLKLQLEDLENYAYEMGEAGLPSNRVMEKQNVIINELQKKLNIDFDQIEKMTTEDLKYVIECALNELANPLKMKEQLLNQLKTQIQDLERFVSFLQNETDINKSDISSSRSFNYNQNSSESPNSNKYSKGDFQNETTNRIQKAMTLLQMFTMAHFGCGGGQFHKSNLTDLNKAKHWNDLQMKFNIAVQRVIDEALLEDMNNGGIRDNPTMRGDEVRHQYSGCVLSGSKLILAIRKDLTAALRNILEHGLYVTSRSTSLIPFTNCLPVRTPSSMPRLLHAWDVILAYYKSKRASHSEVTPQQKLCESFGLTIASGGSSDSSLTMTNKHTLLGAISDVISTHSPLKRSADAHFKAFVCVALNKKKLCSWLRLIYRTQTLVEEYYQPWGYSVSTRFSESIQCLSQIEQFSYKLPEDLAVRHFQNIKDIF